MLKQPRTTWTMALLLTGTFFSGYILRDFVVVPPASAEPKRTTRPPAGKDKLVRLPDGRIVRVLPDGTTQAFSETDGLSVEAAQYWTTLQMMATNGTEVLAGFGCQNPEKLGAELRPQATDSLDVIDRKKETMRAIAVTALVCSGQMKAAAKAVDGARHK